MTSRPRKARSPKLLELLRSEESRLIVEDIGALEDAVRLIAGIRLN
jgi:hypothetical protein